VELLTKLDNDHYCYKQLVKQINKTKTNLTKYYKHSKSYRYSSTLYDNVADSYDML